MWSVDVLATRKTTCWPEAISHYLTSCSWLVCIAKLFADLVDSDDLPRFEQSHESLIQGLHSVAVVRWEENDVNMIFSM